MTRRDVERIIQAKYDDYQEQIIARYKDLPPGNAWEGFAEDIQRGESIVYEEYERMLDLLCTDLLKGLKDHELELLWFESDASFDCDGDKPCSRCEWADGVREELAKRVRGAAADLDLDEGGFAFDEEALAFFSDVAAVLSRLVDRPNCGPDESKAVRRAVAALRQLPNLTPGINIQIEVGHTVGDEQFRETCSCAVNLDGEQIEISSGGCRYEPSVGSDSYRLESFIWHASGECESNSDRQAWLERLAYILDDEDKRIYITDESDDNCPERTL